MKPSMTNYQCTLDDDQRDQVSVISTSAAAASEQSDEFIRNFFIKFGMRRTLEAF